jgi:endonuclease YncB( thermonuclease family)
MSVSIRSHLITLIALCLLGTLNIGVAFASGFSKGTRLEGMVVGVSDGDTLNVLLNGNQSIRVRLAEIDAPEKSQAFGQVSKQSLSDLVYRKQISIVVMSTDKYGRTVGRVHAGVIDVNLMQVSRGLAWAYTQYLTDQSIAKAEQIARSQKLGLWSEKDPTPPWLFRRGDEGRAAHAPNVSHDVHVRLGLKGESDLLEQAHAQTGRCVRS